MGLGILKDKDIRSVLGMAAFGLLAGALFPMEPVRAVDGNDREEHPFLYGTWSGDDEDIMELQEVGAEYKVLPGESLWDISEKLWGDGARYGELIAANEEVSGHPDLIYPGTNLQTGRSGYIVKGEASQGGMQTGDYSFHVPGSWSVGVLSSRTAYANLTLFGSGSETIACQIQNKKEETVLTTQDWESCAEAIRDYVGEHYPEAVSELSFEHYRMGEGEEVYLYSFLWRIDVPETEHSMQIPVCMGIKLTEHMQAEFLGFAGNYDIHGGVRYVTASFQEYEGYDPERSSVNDSNMAIRPEGKWEMKGLCDPFYWAETFFTELMDEKTGNEPEPENLQERMIDRISRPAGRR